MRDWVWLGVCPRDVIKMCRVWSWGWGVHGQLGLRSVDDRAVPTHSNLLDNKQVSFIAAGYGHSAILTAEVSNCDCALFFTFEIKYYYYYREKSTPLEMVSQSHVYRAL